MAGKKVVGIAGHLRNIPIGDIVPSGDNPRILNLKSKSFLELLESVKASGVQVPVHVREHPKKKGKYDLRAGERRLKAAQLAKLETIPAIVHEDMDNQQAFELTFAENFGREDLTPMEEGKAVAILMLRYKNDIEAVAARLGQTNKWVKLRETVHTNLSAKWQKEMANPKSDIAHNYTIGHLSVIARLPKAQQDEIFSEYGSYCEDWPIDTLKLRLEREFLRLLKTAPWKLDDTDLVPKAGSCRDCKKRTGCEPLLWDAPTEEDAQKNDRCLDRKCWNTKRDAYLGKRIKDVKDKYPKVVWIAKYSEGQGRKAAEKNFGDILDNYSYTIVKKNAKDAKPALIVCGPSVGTLKWIKTARGVSPARSAKTAGPRSLAQRKAALRSKRWCWVLGELKELVEGKGYDAIKYADKRLAVMELIAEFGVDSSMPGRGWKDFTSAMDSKDKNRQTLLLQQLWRMVRPELLDSISYNGPVTQLTEVYIKYAKAIATLLQIDIDKIHEDACLKHKEPKSWANLKADGTEKKKAAGK